MNKTTFDQGVLKVDDLKTEAEKYLTDKTKKALEKQHNGLTRFGYDSNGTSGIVAQCIYIGKTVALTELEEGIKYVADKLNKLGEAGKIDSRLSHMIKFDLAVDPPSPPKTIVLFYVLVSNETYADVMANLSEYGAFIEGAVP